MCLIAFALEGHPDYSLVLIANRDEFHHRPTREMHWWSNNGPLAGRDERSGGTWLAIMPDGRLAAVTNFRSPTVDNSRRTRGELPLRLLEAVDMKEELNRIIAGQRDYGQFNLIGFDGNRMFSHGSESSEPPKAIREGLHGLSNHLLDTPWPKLQQGRRCLHETLAHHGDKSEQALHQSLLDQFSDGTPADPDDLPDTGVGEELESFLSPMFILGEQYGTRATSVVTQNRQGGIRVTERRFGPMGSDPKTLVFQWQRTHESR